MQSPKKSRDQDDIVGHNHRQLTPIEACYPSEKQGKVHHVNKEKQAKYLTRRTAIQEGKEQKDKEEDLQVGVQRHRGKTKRDFHGRTGRNQDNNAKEEHVDETKDNKEARDENA